MSTSSGSPEPTEATSSLSPNNEPMPSQAANAHLPSAQPKSWLGQAAKPDRLDVSIDDVEHFRIWKHRWDGYYALSGLSQVDSLTQYHVLMSCLADETIRVVDNLPLQKWRTPECDGDRCAVRKAHEGTHKHRCGTQELFVSSTAAWRTI